MEVSQLENDISHLGPHQSLCGKFQDENDNCSDLSNISIPKTLDDLIQELQRVFSSEKVNVEYVQTLMTLYKSNPKEWKKFAKFDTHRYTRNLVYGGSDNFNLMVLCWNEGQGSSIHSHAGSHCFLKVLQGNAREEMYDWPSESRSHTEMCPSEINTFQTNQCKYINDDIGLHRVENPSHTDKAVTLHLYSPPFDECKTFDQKTSTERPARVTFWSKFGKRTPFGKDASVPSAADAENN